MTAPVDLALAKQQLHVDGSDDDTLIAAHLASAHSYVARLTGLVFEPDGEDGRTETFDRFAPALRLSAWPVVSILAVSYLDAAGAEQMLDGGNYRLAKGSRPARLSSSATIFWPITLQSTGAVSVTYRAGFATPSDVPAEIKTAILMLVDHWYRNRSAVVAGDAAAAVDVPFGVEQLLWPHRIPNI